MVSGIEALGSSPLMHGMGEDELGTLLRTAEERTYNVGDCIIEEGKPSDCLYIRVAGVVVVTKGLGDDQVMLNTLDQCGDFFGEMSLIDIIPHSANVYARDNVRVLAIPKQVLTTLFIRVPRIQMTLVLNIARNLSLRLREADERIAELAHGKE